MSNIILKDIFFNRRFQTIINVFNKTIKYVLTQIENQINNKNYSHAEHIIALKYI